jgi:hypothetical protein
MGRFWVEGTDEAGNEWSARWGDVSDAQADTITAFIEAAVGRSPDTIC